MGEGGDGTLEADALTYKLNMKIVNDILQQPRLVNEIRTQAAKEQRFLGSEKRNKGHILFEFNLKTGDLQPAQLSKEVSVDIEGAPVYKTKIFKNTDCVYVQALNEKNALKRLLRGDIIRR